MLSSNYFNSLTFARRKFASVLKTQNFFILFENYQNVCSLVAHRWKRHKKFVQFSTLRLQFHLRRPTIFFSFKITKLQSIYFRCYCDTYVFMTPGATFSRKNNFHASTYKSNRFYSVNFYRFELVSASGDAEFILLLIKCMKNELNTIKTDWLRAIRTLMRENYFYSERSRWRHKNGRTAITAWWFF